MISAGILLAIGAMLSWGFGDFFIQRSSRKIGVWHTLFFIGLGGFVGLLPFVQSELSTLFQESTNITLLFVTILVALAAALFYFQALKVGKIAVIEPVTAIELPIAIGLSIAIAGEQLTALQSGLALLVFLGILLAITEHHSHLHYHKRILEKGVVLALVGAVCMGLNDLLMGLSARNISPLLSVWFIHSMLGAISFAYLLSAKKAQAIWTDLKEFPALITLQSLFGNIAWVFYALAVNKIPISIAATISEAYIVLGIILGVVFNKEKLKNHQFLGIGLATAGVILISAIS